MANLQGASVTTADSRRTVPSKHTLSCNHTRSSALVSSLLPALQSLRWHRRHGPGSALVSQRQKDGPAKATDALWYAGTIRSVFVFQLAHSARQAQYHAPLLPLRKCAP